MRASRNAVSFLQFVRSLHCRSLQRAASPDKQTQVSGIGKMPRLQISDGPPEHAERRPARRPLLPIFFPFVCVAQHFLRTTELINQEEMRRSEKIISKSRREFDLPSGLPPHHRYAPAQSPQHSKVSLIVHELQLSFCVINHTHKKDRAKAGILTRKGRPLKSGIRRPAENAAEMSVHFPATCLKSCPQLHEPAPSELERSGRRRCSFSNARCREI